MSEAQFSHYCTGENVTVDSYDANNGEQGSPQDLTFRGGPSNAWGGKRNG
jgi:hypothetical protein